MPVAPDTPLQFVVFGDSLSDPGNLYALADGVVTEETRDTFAGESGRVSDGPVAVEYAAAQLGVERVANYALAAAPAAGPYTLGDLLADKGVLGDLLVPPDDPVLEYDFSLSAQTERFLAEYGTTDLGEATAFILIGGNDFNALDFDDMEGIVGRVLATVVRATLETFEASAVLLDAGVGEVVISTLPSAAFFPLVATQSPVIQAAAAAASAVHNALLGFGVEQLAAQGANVTLLDLTAISEAILDDPSAFGFIAPVTDTLTGTPDILDTYDADQIVFWDDLHTTTAAHGVMGAYMAHALAGNTVTALDDRANATAVDTGDDLVLAYGGWDRIETGDGADVVFGGTGNDLLQGGTGDDLLSGGSGMDLVAGNDGADVLGGNEGRDLIAGQAGDDVLIDGLGRDLVLGGAGDDTFIFVENALSGGTGTDGDRMLGGPGDDTLYLVVSAETIAAHGDDPDMLAGVLGLSLRGIETVVVLEERTALDTLSGEDWYEDADLWGFV